MTPEQSKREARSDEDEGERLDRELLELLNELRVVMPGVQVMVTLFAWLWFGLAFVRRASGRTGW